METVLPPGRPRSQPWWWSLQETSVRRLPGSAGNRRSSLLCSHILTVPATPCSRPRPPPSRPSRGLRPSQSGCQTSPSGSDQSLCRGPSALRTVLRRWRSSRCCPRPARASRGTTRSLRLSTTSTGSLRWTRSRGMMQLVLRMTKLEKYKHLN